MLRSEDPVRMLFYYRGWNSGTNQALLQAWRSGSPELEIKDYDVCPLAKKSIAARLTLLPYAIHHSGVGVITAKNGKFMDAVKRSTWYMKETREKIKHIQQQENYDYSLSMTTALPVIKPRRPNFIYTDLTILANLYYPGGSTWIDLWREYLPYEKEAIESASVVFTMSEHVTKSLTEQYGIPPEKICRVNGGCNTPSIHFSDPYRYHRQDILFIGVDWERKGGPELVEAFYKVKKRYPKATLTVIGCSPRISGIGVNVAGPVPQEAIPRYLERASVFCMPSKREPFGIVLLEAMMAGLPVVTSKFGAAPDFIIDGETGYKVDPSDVDQIALYLEEIIGNPERSRQMAERGRKYIEAHYSWGHTQSKMWRVIKSVIMKQ